jgi:Mg2+ and Co2+ transporter CorA
MAVEASQAILKIKLSIVKIVAQDWNLVLSQMCETLDVIDAKIAGNHELRCNVLAWRKLLCTWRVMIIDYSLQLEEASAYIRTQRSENINSPVSETSENGSLGQAKWQNEEPPPSVQSVTGVIDVELDSLLLMFKILINTTKRVEGRVDRSFHALMASMSIAESERAIVQGSAIARLTELAFIFIPLNFACAFFSMQITVSA